MSIMYENKLFSACFIVWMYRYTTFEIKVDLCAHTYGKIGTFTAEYIPPTFLTRTPSPFSAGSSWGLLSRKIFYFFLNPLSTRSNYTSIFIFFLIFARNLSEVGIENILNFILVILDYKIPRIFFSC